MKVPFKYLRISEDPLNLRAGVARQHADTTELLTRRQWDGAPPRVFEDNDISAWKRGVRRPAFEQMLLELDQASCLVAYDLDRLVRQPRDLERLIDRCADVKLTRVATAKGDIDLTSHDGQLQARILAAVATKASDDTSRRVTRALRDRAERGLWTGNRAPIGYRLVDGELVLDNSADHVRALVESVLEHRINLTDAARELRITRAGLRRVLLSPTLIARTATGHAGYWPALLDDITQARLRELLDNRTHGPISRSDHWLTGILRCGVCEGAMAYFGGKTDTRSGCYGCSTCRTTRGNLVEADGSERFVGKWIVEFANASIARAEPATTPAPRSPNRPRSGTAAAASPAQCPPSATPDQSIADERIAEMARLYAQGQLPKIAWETALAEYAERAPGPTPAASQRTVAASLAVEWPGLEPAEKRRRAGQVLECVRVDVAQRRGRFDPARLHPSPRADLVWS